MIFYKYLTPEAAIKVLKNRTLKYSSPQNFNDPYDCQFDLYPKYDFSEVIDSIRNKLWGYYVLGIDPSPRIHVSFRKIIIRLRKSYPGMNRSAFYRCCGVKWIIDKVTRTLKEYREVTVPVWQENAKVWRNHSIVLCLSESFDDMLMWPHYAQNHEGVVLGFSVSEDPNLKKVEAVRYQDGMPCLLTQNQIIASLLGEIDEDQFSYEEIAKKQIFTKASCWSYEKEQRVVLDGKSVGVPDVQKYAYMLFEKDALVKVCIGCRANANTFNKIILLAAQFPKAGVYQVKSLEREYRLELENIN